MQKIAVGHETLMRAVLCVAWVGVGAGVGVQAGAWITPIGVYPFQPVMTRLPPENVPVLIVFEEEVF
jgi:hypothetical protein